MEWLHITNPMLFSGNVAENCLNYTSEYCGPLSVINKSGVPCLANTDFIPSITALQLTTYCF